MRIMTIGAHLDDIEIGCGGLIADAVAKGHIVKMLVMSRSGYTNFDGKVWRTDEEALKEGKVAAAILGVVDLEVLNFPIKNIPYNSTSVETLDKKITAFEPNLIITQWVYDTHQDHRNTALASISAARYYENILMYEPIWPSGRSYQGFRGQLYYVVSKDGVDKKVSALKTHESQYEKYGNIWLDAVQGRGAFRGLEVKNGYAECFEVIRWRLGL